VNNWLCPLVKKRKKLSLFDAVLRNAWSFQDCFHLHCHRPHCILFSKDSEKLASILAGAVGKRIVGVCPPYIAILYTRAPKRCISSI
jgi:hypothetical protein